MFQLLARRRPNGEGRASLLCPASSDIHLLGDGQSIVYLDAEIPNSALNFAVAQQELDGT
jgi:hypothetical protein